MKQLFETTTGEAVNIGDTLNFSLQKNTQQGNKYIKKNIKLTPDNAKFFLELGVINEREVTDIESMVTEELEALSDLLHDFSVLEERITNNESHISKLENAVRKILKKLQHKSENG